ncbi:MAG: hypothetical protein KC619_10190 [Myxococcales bacterium]|nr:hypothetical protein [Myxococcales bacterium]
MRRLAAIVAFLVCAAPALAQSPRPPRVQVLVERGPLPVRVLQRAWPGRAFRRCQEDSPDDVVHLHVRIDPDASIVVEHGLLEGQIRPSERCVVEVLTSARFPAQTEATHAVVTIWFAPPMAHQAQSPASSRVTSARPSASYSATSL